MVPPAKLTVERAVPLPLLVMGREYQPFTPTAWVPVAAMTVLGDWDPLFV